jgi:outer membrane protein assembly factor BamB
MKKLFFILIVVLSLNACKDQKKVSNLPKPKLTFLWETDTLLTTVESVIFDAKSKFIYTSNIQGNPGEKDGQGSISKLNINGHIIKRDWISGLNAPKGMDIFNGKLFVTDIDRLVEIDIEKGIINKEYLVEGAVFLNDITISSDGIVYFSDTDTNKIFILEKNKINLFSELDSPNGLLVEKNKLLAVSWSKKTFNQIDIITKKITQISDSIPNPDGIESIENGAFFISSWNGKIYHISRIGTKTLLLDTSKEKVFSADIDYVAPKKILLVPTFFANKIMAYRYSE